jgi:hypothetical protein
MFEFGLALNGFSISEVSDRVVAADREPRFVAPSRIDKERRYQEPNKRHWFG